MPPESPVLLIPGISAMMPVAFLDVGMRREDFPVDRGLHLRALHVDDRRFAGDRDGFLEGADSQIGVDRRDEVPLSSMPSRFTVLKPVSVNVTE